MEQYTDNQYDDDLTVGSDEYDESYYTDGEDLFAFSADEESPISRLKSLILSIDWEITDDILLQFNEELLDLRDIWAGEKINLVYVQALEKISKYIYHKKADSHPNAIKLLLTLYHNLEKIVASPVLSETEKKAILAEDIERFEGLKQLIGGKVEKAAPVAEPKIDKPSMPKQVASPVGAEDLLNLKAVVLGIDWEITDRDLEDLRQEVLRLEELYASSKPRLILLQGIGTLGAYIKLKKSNAHADAFKVLHFFYESLEEIAATPMSLEEEKEILFPAVEMFNSFKAVLGPTITPEAISRTRDEDDENGENDDALFVGDTRAIVPALSEIPEEEMAGFQAEVEARGVGIDNVDNVDTHVDAFFNDKAWQEAEEAQDIDDQSPQHVSAQNDDQSYHDVAGVDSVQREVALQGVNVEEGDEEEQVSEESFRVTELAEESAEPSQQEIDPVTEPLDTTGYESLENEELAEVDSPEELLPEKEVKQEHVDIDAPGEEVIPIAMEDATEVGLGEELVLPGVDVETEADDDADEEPLPFAEGDLAPALSLAEDEPGFVEEEEFAQATTAGEKTEEEILSTIDGFFDEAELPATADWAQDEPEKLDEESERPGTPDDLVNHEIKDEPAASESALAKEMIEDLGLPEDVVEGEESSTTEEELLSFEDEKASIELLVEEENDLSIEADEQLFELEEDDLELEDNLEAFFADTTESELPESEPDTKEQDLETTTIEEELEAVEQLSEEETEAIDPPAQLEDSADVETTPEEIVLPETDAPGLAAARRIPPFKLATPKARPALLSSEVEAKQEKIVELNDEDSAESLSEVIASEPVEFTLEQSTPGVEDDAEEEVVFELIEDIDEETIEDDFDLGEEDSYHNFVPEQQLQQMSLDSQDPLSRLKICIDSLGVEIEDKVISGLYGAIHSLRQRMATEPVEKTFLQLLSTITQHIDKYRYDSSDNAFALLRSGYAALSDIGNNDLQANHERLLIETNKVLGWQQEMLNRQTLAMEDDQPGFISPDSTFDEVSDDTESEFDQPFQEVEQQGLETNNLEIPAEESKSLDFEDENDAEESNLDSESIRVEIINLRETLQKEIAELKKAMEENKKL